MRRSLWRFMKPIRAMQHRAATNNAHPSYLASVARKVQIAEITSWRKSPSCVQQRKKYAARAKVAIHTVSLIGVDCRYSTLGLKMYINVPMKLALLLPVSLRAVRKRQVAAIT